MSSPRAEKREFARGTCFDLVDMFVKVLVMMCACAPTAPCQTADAFWVLLIRYADVKIAVRSQRGGTPDRTRVVGQKAKFTPPPLSLAGHAMTVRGRKRNVGCNTRLSHTALLHLPSHPRPRHQFLATSLTHTLQPPAPASLPQPSSSRAQASWPARRRSSSPRRARRTS